MAGAALPTSLRRLLGFGLLPAVSVLGPLLLLPTVARAAEPEEWLAIAVGASTGGLASLAVGLAWPVVGPVRLSGANPSDQRLLFVQSVASRLLMLGPVLLVACAVGWLLSPTAGGLAAATAAAGALGGLSPAWFAVGLGRPGQILVHETLPRLAGLLAAFAVIAAGGGLLAYPLLPALTALVGAVVFARRWMSFGDLLHAELWTGARRTIRAQLAPSATTLVAAAYTTASVPLVSVVATVPEAASYASGSRYYQFSLLGLTALAQTLVSETRAGRQSRRFLVRGTAWFAAFCCAGFVLVGVIGPSVTRVLFTDDLAMRPGTAVPLGLALVAVAWGTFAGQLVLVPSGRTRAVFVAVCTGAVVGVPATMVLAAHDGAAGGAWGLCLAEVVTAAHLAWSCWRSSTSPSSAHARNGTGS